MRTACSSATPAASMVASVAITVSPAPLTSDTSRFSAFTCSTPALAIQRHALLAARQQQRFQAELPAQLLRAPRQVASLFQAPTIWRSSSRFGVIRCAPR